MVKWNRRVIFGITFAALFAVVRFLFNLSAENGTASPTVPDVTSLKKQDDKEHKCFYDSSCSPPQILFRIRTETDNSPPFACLNDIRIFDASNVERGINVAALNGTTGDVVDTSFFDVTASDEKLMRWLTQLPEKSVIVAVSFGDIAEHVSRHARQIFGSYGAERIDGWRAGSAYTVVGQRGIDRGKAYETISGMGDAKSTVFEGCFELPLAETKARNLMVDVPDVHRADENRLAELGAFEDDLLQKRKVEFGDTWQNCGMEKQCTEDSIAVHFFSGEHKDDHPKMCIDGKLLFDKDLNNAGRGLNLAMIEPKTGRVSAAAHFDTYDDESRGLEEWLDAVPTGYIVAVVSFDEASNMLSEMARRIFYEMGSSMIDRLKFRASWYFVGQKGIGAYTPFEDLNVPSGNNWAKPIKNSFCLPKSLNRWAGRRESVKKEGTSGKDGDQRNLPKRHFCAKYDRHEQFCTGENLDEPIVPRLLRDARRTHDPIFNVPIVVITGLAPDSLRATLQSLNSQEGINTQMVLVTYDKEYSENAELASLFHFKSFAIASNASYNDMLLLSMSNAFSVFPEATSLIVVEEDVVLSPDWLQYLSSVLHQFVEDNSIDLALAFNPNGFVRTSGNASTVYRVANQLPLYSYMMKRDLYEKHIRLRPFCCTERYKWDLRESSSLVAALSRIEVVTDELDRQNPLFASPRIFSSSTERIEFFSVSSEDYESTIEHILRSGNRIRIDEVDCKNWGESFAKLDSGPILVTYSNKTQLEKAVKCFGLYSNEKMMKNNQIFRFALRQNTDVLIVPE